MDLVTKHTDNELVADAFPLKKRFTFDSGWIELLGWDFSEAAYVASFANSK